MPAATHPHTMSDGVSTTIGPNDMTGDQLALPSSEKVFTITQFGRITGGRVKNGCQVFLNVPYGLDVPRWTDPQPLPSTYRYPDVEYTVDGKYCAQPRRTYSQTNPMRERLGLGTPTENPFFADIYVPSHYEFDSGRTTPQSVNSDDSIDGEVGNKHLLPVRVFIHGGFLQYGSTSGNHYNQQFFPTEHYNEIRVLLGHRLSVLGFLGAEKPEIKGNYGFKDCWLGLEWVRENIQAFGGDPNNVHLSGLSGGGHVVHQLVHHAARLAPEKAPFITAHCQSNAILANPVTPASRNSQFALFASLLGVDPSSPSALEDLRDTTRFPTDKIISAVEGMGEQCTFRGVVGDDEGWVEKDQIEYQQSGRLGRDLKAAGVKCLIVGDVRDEDHFYAGVHPSKTTAEILPNVARYYPLDVSERFVNSYPALKDDASEDEINARLGRILADGQVHLPVRLLASDLANSQFPVIRYAIESVSKSYGTNGKASHGTDLSVHQLRLSILTPEEINSALEFNKVLWDEVATVLVDGDRGEFEQKGEEEMLVLSKNGETAWKNDWRWPLLRNAQKAFRP